MQLRHGLSLCRVYITPGCARAFDRKPSLGMVPSNVDVQAYGTRPQSANTASVFIEKSSSTDSFNSRCDDYGMGTQQATTDSGNIFEVETATEDVSFWDLTDLGWL